MDMKISSFVYENDAGTFPKMALKLSGNGRFTF